VPCFEGGGSRREVRSGGDVLDPVESAEEPGLAKDKAWSSAVMSWHGLFTKHVKTKHTAKERSFKVMSKQLGKK